jgi:hypothetical protein
MLNMLNKIWVILSNPSPETIFNSTLFFVAISIANLIFLIYLYKRNED